SVLAAVIASTVANESTSATVINGGPTQGATAVANDIIAEVKNNTSGHGPALSRADVARYVSVDNNRVLYTGDPKTDETKESIARALAEVGQTRTWGLLTDLVAQTGHYAPSATGLANFVVDGEKRYWLHVSIDRFDGTVL